MRNLIDKVKHFIQRGRRGYDETSHWSADNYLSGVMAGVLNDLADYSHGTPLSEDYIIDNSDVSNPEVDHEKWIAHIRSAADILQRYHDYQFDSEFDEPTYDEMKEVFDWLGEYWGALWD